MVGHPVGLIRLGVNIGVKVLATDGFVYGSAVSQNMQVIFGEFRKPLAAFVFDIGVAHVPLLWNLPIKNLFAR